MFLRGRSLPLRLASWVAEESAGAEEFVLMSLFGTAESFLDLLERLLLADTVLLRNLVGKTVLVALDRGEVIGGELVELGAEGVADVVHSIGHCA
jgi:hypothetical protein